MDIERESHGGIVRECHSHAIPPCHTQWVWNKSIDNVYPASARAVDAVTETFLNSLSGYTERPIRRMVTENTSICINFHHGKTVMWTNYCQVCTIMALDYHSKSLDRLQYIKKKITTNANLPARDSMNRFCSNFTLGLEYQWTTVPGTVHAALSARVCNRNLFQGTTAICSKNVSPHTTVMLTNQSIYS